MYENNARNAKAYAYQQEAYTQAAQAAAYGAVCEISELERIRNRLDDFADLVAIHRDHACRAASKLMGEAPPNAKAGAVAPVRSGLCGQIEDKLDTINNIMRETDEAFARLRQGI